MNAASRARETARSCDVGTSVQVGQHWSMRMLSRYSFIRLEFTSRRGSLCSAPGEPWFHSHPKHNVFFRFNYIIPSEKLVLNSSIVGPVFALCSHWGFLLTLKTLHFLCCKLLMLKMLIIHAGINGNKQHCLSKPKYCVHHLARTHSFCVSREEQMNLLCGCTQCLKVVTYPVPHGSFQWKVFNISFICNVAMKCNILTHYQRHLKVSVYPHRGHQAQ